MIPFLQIQTLTDEIFAPSKLSYVKAGFADEPTDAPLIDVLVARAASLSSPWAQVEVLAMGGAIDRVEAGATAFPDRDARWLINIPDTWVNAGDTEAEIDWVRGTFAALEPHFSGGAYVNFMDGDEAGSADVAYGLTLDRLRAVKATYDPDNVFRLNQNISRLHRTAHRRPNCVQSSESALPRREQMSQLIAHEHPVTALPGKPEPYVLEAGSGRAHVLLGEAGRALMGAEETSDRMSVMTLTGPRPGRPIPLHYHAHEQEFFYCWRGQIQVWADDESRVLAPGDFGFIPPGTVHAYQLRSNHSSFIGPIFPAGWDRFFDLTGEPYAGGAFPQGPPGPPPFEKFGRAEQSSR